MNSEESFEILQIRLNAALDTARNSVIQAINKSEFTDAQVQARRAEEIVKYIDQLHAFRNRWEELGIETDGRKTAPAPAQSRRRARTGARTPERAFRVPILQALQECGGSGRVKDVLDRVGEIMRPVLKSTDFEILASQDEARWRNTAKWERSRMVNEGLLKPPSRVGTWEISSAGREYLHQHKE